MRDGRGGTDRPTPRHHSAPQPRRQAGAGHQPGPRRQPRQHASPESRERHATPGRQHHHHTGTRHHHGDAATAPAGHHRAHPTATTERGRHAPREGRHRRRSNERRRHDTPPAEESRRRTPRDRPKTTAARRDAPATTPGGAPCARPSVARDGEAAKRGQDSPSRLAHGDTRCKIENPARAARNTRDSLQIMQVNHPGAAGLPA